MAKKTSYLLDLPNEVLRHIAQVLAALPKSKTRAAVSDVLNLACTYKTLRAIAEPCMYTKFSRGSAHIPAFLRAVLEKPEYVSNVKEARSVRSTHEEVLQAERGELGRSHIEKAASLALVLKRCESYGLTSRPCWPTHEQWVENLQLRIPDPYLAILVLSLPNLETISMFTREKIMNQSILASFAEPLKSLPEPQIYT